MCITMALAAASVAIGGVGAISGIGAANANKKAQIQQLKLQNRQLREQAAMEGIASANEEFAKALDFEAGRSASLAAIGASGVGENISFFQGLDPANKAAFSRDVANLRLNLTAKEGSISDQIGVNDVGMKVAKINANASKVGAVTDFMQTAMSAASFYSQYRTPARAGGG